MDSIVHFEIPADNTKRASDFYNKAFGWMINPMPEMDYIMIGTAESDENGMPKNPGRINGGMAKRGGPVEHIVVTISVEDIDKTLQNVERLGGKKLVGKTPIGEMGFTAYFKDTEGNTIGLFQAPTGM
jgi:uncharacterized protein